MRVFSTINSVTHEIPSVYYIDLEENVLKFHLTTDVCAFVCRNFKRATIKRQPDDVIKASLKCDAIRCEDDVRD